MGMTVFLRVYQYLSNGPLTTTFRDPCRKKDDTLPHEKRYKIIVGFATDKGDCLLYGIEFFA